jgi:hypothetical protein
MSHLDAFRFLLTKRECRIFLARISNLVLEARLKCCVDCVAA